MYLEEGWPRDMVSGLAIWNIWKPRNQRVFGGTEDYNTSPLGPATRMLQDIQRAAEHDDKPAKRSRRVSMVGLKYYPTELEALEEDC
ncbi:hypothetical protein NC653_005380 [Populus alba x Populus x berolinensis]|uniref:Uncharacterized protein n=1 Tax=Populus alba x Populus x berolinensis TaxID=444605 RepID=A0AAD6RBR7_9ROSI|nr:hypothetical protein NC653_005380 [Populus alba x Populus x berolinensis]